MNFNRFFFLDNVELLGVLREGREGKQKTNLLKGHISRVFPGVDELKVDQTMAVLGVVSREGELVSFSQRVDSQVYGGRID
jgi:hypothetical protein